MDTRRPPVVGKVFADKVSRQRRVKSFTDGPYVGIRGLDPQTRKSSQQQVECGAVFQAVRSAKFDKLPRVALETQPAKDLLEYAILVALTVDLLSALDHCPLPRNASSLSPTSSARTPVGWIL